MSDKAKAVMIEIKIKNKYILLGYVFAESVVGA